LLTAHLMQAHQQKLPVRLMIAWTSKPEMVDAGADASKLPKSFHIRDDYVDEVTSFDGDAYMIDFKKK
jgi:hypothetical protein